MSGQPGISKSLHRILWTSPQPVPDDPFDAATSLLSLPEHSLASDDVLRSWYPQFQNMTGRLSRRLICSRMKRKAEDVDTLERRLTQVANTTSFEHLYIQPALDIANFIFFSPAAIAAGYHLDCTSLSLDLSGIGLNMFTVNANHKDTTANLPVNEHWIAVFVLLSGVINEVEWSKCRLSSFSEPQRRLASAIIHICHTHAISYALVIDRVQTAVAISVDRETTDTVDTIRCEAFSTCDTPIRAIIATMIYVVASAYEVSDLPYDDHPDAVLGALPSRDLRKEMYKTAQSTEGFDLYSMQRRPSVYRHFITWKARARADAIPLAEGIVLRALGYLPKSIDLLRSPYPGVTLDQEDYRFLTSYPRTHWNGPFIPYRDSEGKMAAHFRFRVDKLVDVGADKYSQVVAGHMVDENGDVYTPTLCLKLYDERFFRDPPYLGDLGHMDDDVSERLPEWVTPKDIVQREEAAYERLSHLQGSLVPQVYGFYEFELPGRYKCLGLLMEYIDGPTMYNMPSLQAQQWTQERQIQFFLFLRAAFRAVRYAGITYRDYHRKQFLMPPVPREVAARVSSDILVNVAPPIVLLDFGFAFQPSCLCHLPREDRDWDSLRTTIHRVRGVDIGLMCKHWKNRDRYELS